MAETTPSHQFKLRLELPKFISLGKKKLDREAFFAWLWREFQKVGLVGVHEGTLLSEEAFASGQETESWTVDPGEAPRERDWVGAQDVAEVELYFDHEKGAQSARAELEKIGAIKVSEILIQKNEDWDAIWKASFLGNEAGVKVAPCWRVLPPWVTQDKARLEPGEVPLRINPGAGFGTGTHETTQLCLRAISEIARGAWAEAQPRRALDFGSGSGILSIGAALQGFEVDAVEIDRLAIDNAIENSELNGVTGRIHYGESLGSVGVRYELVVANILRPVLLEFAEELVKRMKPQGALVLSGLIESDVPIIVERFQPLLGGRPPSVRALNEWRALVWSPA